MHWNVALTGSAMFVRVLDCRLNECAVGIGHGMNDYFRRSELLDGIRYFAKTLNLPSKISSLAAIDNR